MIQKYQNKSKIRYIKNGDSISLFNILVNLFILIIIIFFAIILNISNQISNKIRNKVEGFPRCKTYDVVCYSWPNHAFLKKVTQEICGTESIFSSQSSVFATIFSKIKRLIHSFKLSFIWSSTLFKYRFFELKEILENSQARIESKAKLSQNKDSLSMLKGLVLGIKDNDNSYYSSFLMAGMVHILVASGFNVALLAGYFKNIRNFLPGKLVSIFILLFIWLYTWFLGGEPPLLRASLMMSLGMLLVQFGFKSHSKTILFISGLAILLIDLSLVKSLSFWFSILATLGLVIFRNRLILFNSSKTNLLSFFKDEFLTSFSAQILILPLAIFIFNEINWLSFISNSLLLFPVAWFTQVGFIFFIILSIFSRTILSWAIYPFLLIYREIIMIFIDIINISKQFFFLRQIILPGEKIFALFCWILVFLCLYLVTRIKRNREAIFFYEN
jgi:ComEC/Rec2-related protein